MRTRRRVAPPLLLFLLLLLLLLLLQGAAADVVLEAEAAAAPPPTYHFNVLLAGYEAFDGMKSNPAQDIARRLHGKCETVMLREPVTLSICFEGWQLPVNSTGAAMVASALREEPYRWDGVIHMGFEEEAKGLKLELVAANVMATDHGPWSADVPCEKEGTLYSDIVRGGPCVLPTTAGLQYLDLRSIELLLMTHGLAEVVSYETWSRDAGSFYCNEAYYRTLWQIRSRSPAMLVPALFVHLPPTELVPLDKAERMISYIAQSISVGVVGLV
jgi:pyrrolidone-carboxylate peptidase